MTHPESHVCHILIQEVAENMDRAGVEYPALSMFPKVQVLLLHGVLRRFQPKIGWNWRCPLSNPRQTNFRVNDVSLFIRFYLSVVLLDAVRRINSTTRNCWRPIAL